MLWDKLFGKTPFVPNQVWDKLFQPPCYGVFPWDSNAQRKGLCSDCNYIKECFRKIRKREKQWVVEIYTRHGKELRERGLKVPK